MAQSFSATYSVSHAELKRRLTWLTVFRTVATLLLLAVLAARLLSDVREELSAEDSASFALIGFVFLLNAVYGVLLRTGRALRGVAFAQVGGDVLLATSLTFLTGGAESPFAFTYSLAVFGGAILFQQRGALVAALASIACFTGLALLIQAGFLRSPLMGGRLAVGTLAFLLVSTALAQLLVALLAGYLARQLDVAGGALRAREQDLAQLHRLQAQIVASIPSGLLTADPAGRISFVNPAGRAILGLSSNDEPGTLDGVLPDLHRLTPGRRSEVQVATASGDKILGLTLAPLPGYGESLLVVFQDLTELREAEEALRRADRLAALGTLSAQLAHEIRNPLAAMRGSAQMLTGETGLDEGGKRLAEILVRESDRLGGLVEDFLRFARPASPDRRPHRLDRLIEDTLAMVERDPLARGKQIEVSLAPVEVSLDGDQIRQVFLNLVRNALSFAGSGGRVRVTLEEAPEQIRLRVWDSGGRIPPEHLKRIFDPFFTTREGGTGLGLSTAHSIVLAHGGMIDVTSTVEGGTELRVTLPHERSSRELTELADTVDDAGQPEAERRAGGVEGVTDVGATDAGAKAGASTDATDADGALGVASRRD